MSKTNAAQTAAERHELGVEWVPIDQVKPWARNTNTHSREQVAKLARVIERHGWTNPIQLDAGGTVVAGHGRLLAAKKLRMSKVPVVRLAVEGTEAEALALGDNWLARMSVDDDAILAKVVEDLNGQIAFDDLDIDLGDLGLDLQALLDDEDPPPAPDEAPAVQEGPPDSVLGGVYELGPHRLACGDSTEAATWDALLGGEQLQAIWTDAPYGISVVSKDGRIGSKMARGSHRPVIGDESTDTAIRAAKVLLGLGAASVCLWGANYFTEALTPSPCWLIWDKRDGTGSNNFADCEMAWTNHSGPARLYSHHWRGFIGGEGARLHPTQKPVALAEWSLGAMGVPDGALCADAFAGSGPLLIACARTGRIARLAELDPRYCDVIRRRWTRYAVENDIEPGPGALAG